MLTKVRRVCLLLIFAAGLPVCAQVQTYSPAVHISTRSLDDMQDGLHLGSPKQRAELFVRLGIDPSTAKVLVDASIPAEPSVIRPLRANTPEPMAILFVPGSVSNACFLYLLQLRGTKAEPSWHVIDHQVLDSWDGSVSLEIAPLRKISVDDIILHHVNESHGTVFVAGETQVFSVFSGKLVRTLATEDFRNEERLGEDQKARTEEAESRFQRLPGYVWEETRTLTVNGKLTTAERRHWRWSEAKRAFTAGRFKPVEVGAD